MLKDYDMAFNRGSILTKEMLCELYDYARDCLNIRYDCYEDGILEGLAVARREDGSVSIGKGLVKYESRIYRMPREINLSGRITEWLDQGKIKSNTYYQLNFVPSQSLPAESTAESSHSMEQYCLELEVGKKSGDRKGIHFSTFILNGDCELEVYNTNDLKNIAKAKFWNMNHCPYATRYSTTYHPYIFQAVRVLIEKRPVKTPFDYILLNQIYSTGIIEMGLIKTFLCDRGKAAENAGRERILAEFLEALENQDACKEETTDPYGAISELEGGLLP